MGRNAQPLKILKFNRKKHLTKKEIKLREDSEIKLGSKEIKCPAYVRNNITALAKWKECLAIYETSPDILTSADVGHLARYCKAHAEYIDLLNHRDEISHIDSLTLREEQKAGGKLEKQNGEKETIALFKKIDYILSTAGILQIDMAINKKMEALVKMEDRLFLNPLARIKNVMKKEKEKEADPNKSMFGD